MTEAVGGVYFTNYGLSETLLIYEYIDSVIFSSFPLAKRGVDFLRIKKVIRDGQTLVYSDECIYLSESH